MHCSERLCKDVAQLLPAIDLRAWRPASLPLPMIVEKIQIFLVLLGIVGVLAVVAEQVEFPFPILCVIAGLLIGLVPKLPDAKLDPRLSFSSSFPPLLFRRHEFPWDDFRSNFVPIFALAVGLVFATILCVAAPHTFSSRG